MLRDEFPKVCRFASAVFPSEDDDVITSPYNSVLSLAELCEHADCVLPIENQALLDICKRGKGGKSDEGGKSNRKGHAAAAPAANPFDSMNDLVARLFCDLTAPMRFSGQLNVDLNEITTNLVPFPRLQFLMSSLSLTAYSVSILLT